MIVHKILEFFGSLWVRPTVPEPARGTQFSRVGGGGTAPSPLSYGPGEGACFRKSASELHFHKQRVERVQYFKLLGIVSSDLNWQKHIDTIISKASSRIYFLRILKNFGLHQHHHLRHFYVTVIRPVLEYCSVVWHHGLTKAQAESLEAIGYSVEHSA